MVLMKLPNLDTAEVVKLFCCPCFWNNGELFYIVFGISFFSGTFNERKSLSAMFFGGKEGASVSTEEFGVRRAYWRPISGLITHFWGFITIFGVGIIFVL